MRHNNWVKPFIITMGIIAMIVLAFIGYDIYLDIQAEKELELIGYEREQYQQVQAILDEKRLAEEAELERISNLNAYEKLHEGQDINILFIMNNKYILQGEEQIVQWPTKLQSDLRRHFEADISIEFLPTSWSNTAWSWMLYQAYLKDSAYDLIYIDLGVNDIETLDIETFQIFYESLVREAISSPAHVSLIIGNQLRYQESYAETISDIGDYYSVNVFDVRDEIEALDDIDNPTMLLDGQPTSSGYDIYRDLVLTYILNQTKAHRDLTLWKDDYLYENSGSLRSVSYNIELSDAEGFRLEDSEIVSNSEEGYLEYSSSRKYNLLTYLRHDLGGIFDIYIDGEFYQTVDSFNHYVAANTIVIINEEPDNDNPMIIRVEVTELPEVDSYISIHSLSTN